MTLSRAKNKAFFRQVERSRRAERTVSQLQAAGLVAVEKAQGALRLCHEISTTRDRYIALLGEATVQIQEQLAEIERLRELLGKHVVANAPSASNYAN